MAELSRRTLRRFGWLLVPMLAGGAPCGASDPAVDLESVRRIVGYGGAAPQVTPAPIEKLLDGAAFRETLQLGQGKPDWNPRHSGWKAVYDRVRSDLETERPAIVGALDAEKPRNEARESEYLQAIASALSAAEVRTILEYYDTTRGLRYQGFMQRIDMVAAGGIASSVGFGVPPAAGAPQPEADSAKLQRYFEMLMMSDPLQTINAGQAVERDPSGAGAIGMMAAAATASHRAELEAILTEYSADLSGFAAFQKTPAAQSLFKAMARAVEERAQRSIQKPPPDPFDSVRRKYAEQWRAAYLAQSSP